MGGDAIAAMEDLDGARRDPRPQLLAQQRVRHRVVVLLDLDVIIEADPALLPFGVDVGLGRQRLQAPIARVASNSARRLAPRCRDTRSLSCCDAARRIAAFNSDEREEPAVPAAWR